MAAASGSVTVTLLGLVAKGRERAGLGSIFVGWTTVQFETRKQATVSDNALEKANVRWMMGENGGRGVTFAMRP